MQQNYKIYDESTLEAIKKFSEQTVQLMSDDTVKCPFQFTSDNRFANCLFRDCMAFRCNGVVFWCARLEKRDCSDKMLHSVDML